MSKPHFLSWFIVLSAVLEPAHAAKTLKEWQKCMETASSSPKALWIERESGVEGLYEHALNAYSFRPTLGRIQLEKEDCDQLFEIALEIHCEPFGAEGVGNTFLKYLDPRAFDEDRYWAACQKIQSAKPPVSRQQFGREVCGNGVYAGEAITEKNWVNHPEIVEARSLYQEIKQSKDAGNLQRKERKFDYCEPYEDSFRTLYMDQNGKPRIYYYEGGSDDSAAKRELYYDESGKLRFAFIIASAINGTQLEHRIYFSKAGRKIWEIQKRLEGPGYIFPTEWPDVELIQDPVQAFNDSSSCTEIK